MNVIIPKADQPTFFALPKDVRDKINYWLPIVNRVSEGRGTCQSFEALGREMGIRPNTVKKKYYAAKNEGWRGLIDRRELGGDNSKVPSEFIPFWHSLVLENQRNTKKAWEKLARLWRERAPIPGYEGHPGYPNLPRGLGERNLNRPRYLPSKAAIVLARRGIAAARSFLPNAPQDVSHLRFLEYVVFDDVELDFLIVVRESPTPVKLRLIVAMDLCSRVILGYGVRPGLTRPDGVEDGLKLRDMKMVVARLLRTWGVPAEYPMHFIVERATAALPAATKTALAEISDGRIIVHDTSMIVGQVFEFRDKASGNSWGKAWLESFFNPLHGQLADLPGQKGRRYDLAPAELEGRKKELAMLVRAGRNMPIELRYQFRWPFLDPAEAVRELDSALQRLHTSEHRQLQGFDKVLLWKMNAADSWKHGAELAQWPELVGKVLTTQRYETPMERLERKRADASFVALPDCSLQRLMEEQKRVPFRNYQFAFEYQKEDYIYLPDDQLLARLEEEKHYLLWFHPQEMSVVYITRDAPHLGYVGKLTRFTRSRRGDLEAAKETLREKSRILAHALRSAQAPSVDRLRRRATDIAYNTEIVRNVSALEVEVDVIEPRAAAADGRAPQSVRTITSDMARRAEAIRIERADRDARRRAIDDLTDDDMIAAIGNGPAAPETDEDENGAEELSSYFRSDEPTQPATATTEYSDPSWP